MSPPIKEVVCTNCKLAFSVPRSKISVDALWHDGKQCPHCGAFFSSYTLGKLPAQLSLNARVLKALQLAEDTMDYCGGDAWERECTADDRAEFSKLLEDIRKELKP